MTPFEAAMKYVGMVMAIVYIGLGIAITFGSKELFNLDSKYSLALGALLIVYGIFRGYRVFSKYFQK